MQSSDLFESRQREGAPPDRILLIGPVLPYRGGISQHTTMLHRELRGRVDCLTISFSRQYPRCIFPGKIDKDEELSDYREAGVEYLIDSINPLSWAKAVNRAKKFAPSIAILPWWHVYWAPCFGWISRELKRNGIEVVFLCHNAIQHEDARWKRVISDFALSAASRFVVHTSTDKENLLQRFPSRSVQMHPMPVFEHFPLPGIELPRRARLELLFFGFVRPYKGLDVLLEAMTLLKDDDVFLSVVGEFWGGEGEILKYIADHQIADKIEVIGRYVPDREAAAYFTRCDIVVLPYRSATGSAVIPLAYYFGKPVIATRVGGLPDVVEDGATGALIEAGSSSQLVSEIRAVLTGSIYYSAAAIEKLKARLTWSGLADTVLGLPLNFPGALERGAPPPSRTHAVLDAVSREGKARKIIELVKLSGRVHFHKVLEVGTGSGFIASYISRLKCTEVHAVDVADERQVTAGFHFQRVNGTVLPFANDSFDFVISNHVIEHVGSAADQAQHLHEIFRCLEPGGTLYFAVPNRWRLIEPHYKIPLLSWLPERLASAYVQMLNSGGHYDCRPLSRRDAYDLLQHTGFECVDVTLDAIPLTGQIEGGWMVRQVTSLPKVFWRLFSWIMPTLIFVCRKPLV